MSRKTLKEGRKGREATIMRTTNDPEKIIKRVTKRGAEVIKTITNEDGSITIYYDFDDKGMVIYKGEQVDPKWLSKYLGRTLTFQYANVVEE